MAVLLAAMPAAAALPNPVEALMKKHKIQKEHVSIFIRRVNIAAPIAEHQSNLLFNPASLIKLPLTFAAFDLLGASYAWKTRFATDGVINNGVIRGNLIIVGGGDPYITADRFLYFVNDLRNRGIHTINGNIIIDNSLFNLPPHNLNAFDGAEHKPYNVGGGALVVNYGAHRVAVSALAKKAHVYVDPPNDNFVINNRLQLNNSRCRNWRSRISENYQGDERRIVLTLKGKYSIRCKTQSFYTAALTHEANAAGVFIALWKQMGGTFNGVWRIGKTPDNARDIAVYKSPSLAKIVQAMNKHSNNVMARNIFFSIAGVDNTPPYTIDMARSVFGRWMKKQGARHAFFIDNGSGLSRQGQMTAADMARLMDKMWKHPLRSEIIASLPILGVDGTLQKRLTKSAPALGHLKTGSLRGVKNIAGFLYDKNGQGIIFICMIKKSSTRRGKNFQDALIRWTLEQ